MLSDPYEIEREITLLGSILLNYLLNQEYVCLPCSLECHVLAVLHDMEYLSTVDLVI